MNETNLRKAAAGAPNRFNQCVSRLFQVGQKTVDVANVEGDVMQPRPAESR